VSNFTMEGNLKVYELAEGIKKPVWARFYIIEQIRKCVCE